MPDPLEGLAPEPVWRHFGALAAIPRGSKNEAAVREHVLAFARARGLEHRTDAVGNVLVTRPGAGAPASHPPVALQSHLDMVCEKNADTVHDFAKDPIRLVREGAVLRADGTTLGADNGIGCAAMLAVLEASGLDHPPLECVFTIDEETGLTGAHGIDPGLLRARRLLNLDTEEEGAIYVGCAGGIDTVGTTRVGRAAPPDGSRPFRLSVKGLRGGHSGADIHEGRVNAIRLLARVLLGTVLPQGGAVASIDGGSKRNAIPREAFATLLLHPDRAGELRAAIAAVEQAARGEAGRFDTPVSITLEPGGEAPAGAFAGADARRLAAFLYTVPHGVLAMSPDIPGLVQTSTNLAVVETAGDEVRVSTSQRSSVETARVDAGLTVKAAFELAGFSVKQGDGYPGWQPNMSSPLLAVASAVHADVLGRVPEVKAIHAGLECGIIGDKFPGMDAISFGPTIRNAHSPDECVDIPTVAGFWRFLTALLARL